MPALQSDFAAFANSDSATLEILHGLFVLLRRGARFKRAEIPRLACLRILLPRIQAIATGLKFSDHKQMRPLFLHTLLRNRPDLIGTMALYGDYHPSPNKKKAGDTPAYNNWWQMNTIAGVVEDLHCRAPFPVAESNNAAAGTPALQFSLLRAV
jgi:hypothetical protein